MKKTVNPRSELVVFDMLGPVCTYKNNGKIITTEDVADWVPAMVTVLNGKKPISLEEEVKWEEHYLREGVMNVVETPNVIDTILHLSFHGMTPVIASSYTKKGSKFIINELVKQYNETHENQITPNSLFYKDDIFSFTDKGLNKGNPEHWKRVIRPYKHSQVKCVFEDSLKRLNTAIEAYDCPGMHVVNTNQKGIRLKHNQIPRDGAIYTGNMDRLCSYASRLTPIEMGH